MNAENTQERASSGKIALDGTVRILAVERADADTIRLKCSLVLPEDRHTTDGEGATFYTSFRKECGPGIVYSDAAFDDLECRLREFITP